MKYLGLKDTDSDRVATKGEVVTPVRNITPTGTINGTNTTFTLPSTPIANSLDLYWTGIRINEGVGNDFTISGSTITMTVAPAVGDTLLANYYI